VTTELSKIMLNEYVLYTKTRNDHWNVEGSDFYDKHKFFEVQFGQIDDFIDRVAERIRTLGYYPPATLTAFLNLTQLTEKASEKNDSKGFIEELLEDHQSLIVRLRENIHRFATEYGDLGSSDFIAGLMEEHKKMAWF
jgi:starvation-inducible DNA-binding protein